MLFKVIKRVCLINTQTEAIKLLLFQNLDRIQIDLQEGNVHYKLSVSHSYLVKSRYERNEGAYSEWNW